MALKKSIDELKTLVAGGPPYPARLLSSLRRDPRLGAQALYATCKRAQDKLVSEEERMAMMMRFEQEAAENGFQRIAGVDEAGRGPLAGPIVAAAVVLSAPVAGWV